jgi:hypothetical protein
VTTFYSQKDAEIHRLTMNQIEQAELSQRTLDDFKVQVEKNSAKMYDEMKLQVMMLIMYL